MASPKIEFDPGRLLALDRKRSAKRAVATALYDQYQTIRERRSDVKRRAEHAYAEASNGGPRGRHGHEAAAVQLEAEVAELTRQLQDTQVRIDEVSAEAASAGAVFKSALAHAVKLGLKIPAELREAANVAAGNVHPSGIAFPGGAA